MLGPAIVRLTAQPRLLSDGSLQTLRMAGGGNRVPYTFGGVSYRSGVVDLPRFTSAFAWEDAGWTGGARPQVAAIAWVPSLPGDLANYASLYLWKDAPITAEIGYELDVPSGGPVTSTQWRIISDSTVTSGFTGIAEMEMRASSGGADQCSGGTASAISYFGSDPTYQPSNAFDNSGTTRWVSNGTNQQDWLQYTFASAVSVVEVAIQARTDFADYTPKSFSIQYWDGSVWQTAWSVTTGTWSLGETRVFTNPNPPSAGASLEPASWATILSGAVQSVATSDGRLVFTIADNAGKMDKPLVTGHFAGTGNIEGPAEAEGRDKRRSYGYVFNVEGRILDKANNVWEFGDPAKAFQSFVDVKDMGRSASPAFTTVAWQGDIPTTLAALRLATASPGSCVVAPSICCVKWWTQPQGPLTADIIGSGDYGNTAVALAKHIAVELGLTQSAVPSSVTSLVANTANAGVHIGDDRSTAAQALDRLLLGAGLFWRFSAAGTLDVMPIDIANPVATVRAESIVRQRVFLPHKSRRIGYKRNERIHSESEISAVLIATNPDVLSADEKIRWLAGQHADLEGRFVLLRARAVALGISVTALDAARSNWLGYLSNVSPPWNDVSADSIIYSPRYPDNNFPTSWTLSNAAMSVSGVYNVATDSSTTTQGYAERSLSQTGANTYSFGVIVAKDTVGQATRFPVIQAFATGGTAKNGGVAWDTATGEVVTFGSLDTGGVLDLGVEWFAFGTLTTNSNNTAILLRLFPAFGGSSLAAGGSNLSTGGISVRSSPAIAYGSPANLGRPALMGRLNAYSGALTAVQKTISELDAATANQVDGPLAADVNYDNAGTTIQGQVDLDYLLRAGTGGAAVTSGVTAITYTVISGTVNGKTEANGAQALTITNGAATLSITAMTTDTAQVKISFTANGVTSSVTVNLTKRYAPATPGGTGGGGGGSSDVPSQTSGFTAINTATFTTITQSLLFTMPTGKTTLRIVVNLIGKYAKTANQSGPWDVEFKVQRDGVDRGTTQHSDPDPEIGFNDETGNPIAYPGTMQYTLDMPSLTVGVQYTVVVQARVATGTLPTNGVNMTFTGSVALSAP
jgi:hypothetical protein